MVFHKVSKEVVFFLSFFFFSCLFSFAPTSLLLPSFFVVLFIWESIDLELLMFASQILLMLGFQTVSVFRFLWWCIPCPENCAAFILILICFSLGLLSLWDANLDILLPFISSYLLLKYPFPL